MKWPNEVGEVALSRRETFSASHRLHNPNFSDEENHRLYGKCNRINGHGHNYVITVTVIAIPDQETGMIMNITELKALIHEYVLEKVDHKHLNFDVPELEGINPTAENLVIVFWHWLAEVIPHSLKFDVELIETENNSVKYSGPHKSI
ncbi:MAG: 6-carboxytetrahydropterin synthase [Pseudomonadota bacterium]